MHEKCRPSVDELVADPRRVDELSVDEVPALVARLGGLLAVLAARLGERREASADRLLDAEEAARMLGVEKDSLWRRKWPFTVKVAAHTTRYSLNGIQKWIRERVGRKT